MKKKQEININVKAIDPLHFTLNSKCHQIKTSKTHDISNKLK